MEIAGEDYYVVNIPVFQISDDLRALGRIAVPDIEKGAFRFFITQIDQTGGPTDVKFRKDHLLTDNLPAGRTLGEPIQQPFLLRQP